MTIKAIFFDFDYTLGCRDKYAYELYRQLVIDNSDISDDVEREAVIQDCMIWDQKGNVNKTYVADMVFNTYGIRFPDDFDAWWDRHLPEYSLPYDDAEKTLTELRRRGYRIGMLSNGVSEGQRRKLEKAGLADYVDVSVVSGDIGVKKPGVELFEHAARLIGVRPEEAAMVGDIFARDVLGAYRSGMMPIWFAVEPFMPCGAGITVIRSLSELLDIF